MRVFCGVCETFVEVDGPAEVHPSEPYVCGACKSKKPGGSMQLDFDDDPTHALGGPEDSPSMSDLDTFVAEDKTMTVSATELELASSGERPIVAAPEAEPPPEPVSIRDLEMILAPGVEPPSISGPEAAPPSDEVPAEWTALAAPIDARSGRTGQTDMKADDLSVMAALNPVPVAAPRRTPSRRPPPPPPVRISSPAPGAIPAPRDSNADDLQMMATLSPLPAPVLTVATEPASPALPLHLDPNPPAESRMRDIRSLTALHPEFPPEDRPPDSRMIDIKSMTSLYPETPTEEKAPDSSAEDLRRISSAHPPAARRRRASMPGIQFGEPDPDEEVLNLKGGLFTDSSLVPLITPALSAPTAPTESLPPTSGPPTPLPARVASAAPTRTAERRSSRSASARSASKPTASGRQGLLIGVIAVCIAGYFAATRGGAEGRTPPAHPEPQTEANAATPPTAAAPAVAHPDEPSIDDPPAPEPTAPTAPTTPPRVAGPLPQISPPPTTPPATPVVTTPPAVTAAPPPTTEPPPAATTAEAPPAPVGPEFDKAAATAALSAAAAEASTCRAEGDPSGQAHVSVTFANSGRVTSANVSGVPYAGTATGGCIAVKMRKATVPPFEGPPVTVFKTVNVN